MAWVAGSSKESGHFVPEAIAEFTIHVPGDRLPLSRAFARGNETSIEERHGRGQEGDVHRLCSHAKYPKEWPPSFHHQSRMLQVDSVEPQVHGWWQKLVGI